MSQMVKVFKPPMQSPQPTRPMELPPHANGFQRHAAGAYECECGARRTPLDPYRAREATTKLVELVRAGTLPSKVVNMASFREFVALLCPTYVIPTEREILKALEKTRAQDMTTGGGPDSTRNFTQQIHPVITTKWMPHPLM